MAAISTFIPIVFESPRVGLIIKVSALMLFFFLWPRNKLEGIIIFHYALIESFTIGTSTYDTNTNQLI